MVHGLSKTQRLSIAIAISSIFFAAEISGSSMLILEK
jgi:zinc transporter 1